MSSRFRHVLSELATTDAVVAVHHKAETSAFFEVRTGDGRSQLVMMSLDDDDEGTPIVHMMSEIGPADPALYAAMLTRNLSLRYTRIALLENAGQPAFSLVYAYPFAELEALELARAFGEIAFTADALDREFFDADAR